ncbi:MAG: ABC transporter permease [Chloroflexota bacterium]
MTDHYTHCLHRARWSLLSLALVFGLVLSACGGAAPTPTAAPPTQPPPTPQAVAPTQPPAPTQTPAAQAPQVTSKEFNLYAWSEYVPQDLLDAFSQEYGVKVNYDTYSSNEELLAKLQAGASGYDVIIPSDYMFTIMANLGLLEPIDLNHIPNFANIDERFKNPPFDPGNKYSVPYQWGTVAIAVNTEKVQQPITKFADLWDLMFRNNLVVLDDEREIIGMALVVLGYSKNSTDPAQLEAAKQKLLELVPNIKLYDSDSPKTALLSGEVIAGVIWNGEAALAHQENPAIDYILPEEGCGLWEDNLAIPKGAPHKDAAEAFINFVLRPEMSILITRDFPYSNPNKAALDLLAKEDPQAYQAYMGFAATNPPPEALEKCHRIVDVGEATTLWDKVWTEVKGGQ